MLVNFLSFLVPQRMKPQKDLFIHIRYNQLCSLSRAESHEDFVTYGMEQRKEGCLKLKVKQAKHDERNHLFMFFFACWFYFFQGNEVCMFFKIQVSINVACSCWNIRWTWWVGKISFQKNKIKWNQITSSKVILIKSMIWVNIWINFNMAIFIVYKHCK